MSALSDKLKQIMTGAGQLIGSSMESVPTDPYLTSVAGPDQRMQASKQFLGNLGYNTVTGERRNDVSAPMLGAQAAEAVGAPAEVGSAVGYGLAMAPALLASNPEAAAMSIENRGSGVLSDISHTIENLLSKKRRGEILSGRQQQTLEELMKEESRVLRGAANRKNK
jgi:hypothetical protein